MRQIIFTVILIFAFCFAASAQAVENPCPTISITVPTGITLFRKQVLFTAKLGREAEKYNIEYVWTVRGGEVIKGQGTSSLEFLPYEKSGSEVSTVTLEIKGLPKQCLNTISKSFNLFIPHAAVKVDEYGKIQNGDEKARMDSFFTQLQNDPAAEGIIKVRDDKDLMRHLTFLSSYIRLRNFDRTRISFLIANEREQLTQLWIIPAGAEMLECDDDCLIIKTEDFEKLEKLFQPKPKAKKRRK